jgi:hypothetical protein
METLKLTIWQLLIEAMMLTSVAALLSLVASMILVRLLTTLIPSAVFIRSSGRSVDKTLRWFDQLFTCVLANRSYYN